MKHNGIKVQTFMTAGGEVEITHAKKFVNEIPRELVTRSEISWYEQEVLSTAINPYAGTTGSFSDIKQDYTRKYAILKLIEEFKIPCTTRLKPEFSLSAFMQEKGQEVINTFCLNHLKSEIAKRKPEFFLKDLKLSELEDLCIRLRQNFPVNSYLYGFPIALGSNQKFFVIGQADSFRFFGMEPQMVATTTLEYKAIIMGAFAQVRPKAWIVGRCDDWAYIEEIHEREMNNIRYSV